MTSLHGARFVISRRRRPPSVNGGPRHRPRMASTILPSFLEDESKKSSQLSVRDVLELGVLESAKLVAGSAGLARPVLWSHVVDMPDPAPWVPAGYFLLTTGYSWPREPGEQRALI